VQHAEKDGGQWELHKLCVLFRRMCTIMYYRERERAQVHGKRDTHLHIFAHICTYLHISAHDSTYLHIFAQCLGRVCLKKLCIPMAKVHRDKS
jgi:hypothetical protein